MSTTTSKTISLLADMTHEAVSESEINRRGDALTLRPARPCWMSLAELARADADFLQERPRFFFINESLATSTPVSVALGFKVRE